jgi:uncharacterized protein YjbI with pentapeptide repeats
MHDVAPTPVIVSLGATYKPPVVTVLLRPTSISITDANYRAKYLDNVELSTPARVYMSELTGPGPDLSEAITQVGAGPVFGTILGDYTGAVLVGQNLQNVRFDDVNLQDVNFSYANLLGAQFNNALLAGAQFFQADLRGADLSGALGVQPQQFYRANFDRTTTFPDDIGESLFGPF